MPIISQSKVLPILANDDTSKTTQQTDDHHFSFQELQRRFSKSQDNSERHRSSFLELLIPPQENSSKEIALIEAQKAFTNELRHALTVNSKFKFDEASISDFFQGQIVRFQLSKTDLNILRCRILFSLMKEKKDFDKLKMLWVFAEVLLFELDLITDVLTLIQIASSDPQTAVIMGLVLAFSLFIQFIVSFAMGQPLGFALLGLFGIKPVVEAWREAVEAKQFEGQKLSNSYMLWTSRMVGMAMESIPQAIIQSTVLISTATQNRTNLQYISICLTLFSAGFIITTSDRSMDLNPTARNNDPQLYGYVPSKMRDSFIQLVATLLFMSSYLAAKMFALSLLIVSSNFKEHSIIWLLTEYVLLLLARISIRNWRFHRVGADSIFISLLIHTGMYLSLMAAPFFLVRMPVFLTPRLYSIGLLYMIIVNFALVGLSYHYFNGVDAFDESTAWKLLIAITSICISSSAFVFYYVPADRKGTFYKNITFRHYLSTYFWFEKQSTFDKKQRVFHDQDAVRALMPTSFSMYYLPVKLLIDYYGENWSKWELNPPEWFDKDFIDSIPRSLLVKVKSSTSVAFTSDILSMQTKSTPAPAEKVRVTQEIFSSSALMLAPARTTTSSTIITSTPTEFLLTVTDIENVDKVCHFFQVEIDEVYCKKYSNLLVDEKYIESFFNTIKTTYGITDDVRDFCQDKLIVEQLTDLKRLDKFKIINICFEVTLEYADLAMDLVTMVIYMETNKSVAMVQWIILGISMLCQFVTSFAFGQPLWFSAMGLVGLKPLIEAVRDGMEMKRFKTQKLSSKYMLWVCRVVEMTTETIPQVLIQMIAFLMTRAEKRQLIQFVSIAMSLISAGITASTTDRMLDLSDSNRKNDGKIFGYVAAVEDGRFQQSISLSLFFMSYLTSKSIALSVILVSVTWKRFVVLYLVLECMLLLGARMSIGNWRVYTKGADGAGISVLHNFLIYIAMVAMPFPILRLPALMTCRLYSLCLFYMLSVNFGLVGVSYHYFNGCDGIDEYMAWLALFISTTVCLISGAITYYYVPTTYKRTFYENLTLKRHFETFWWDEATERVDSKGRILRTRDGIRACLGSQCSVHYMPKAKLTKLFSETWKLWEADPPDWFDEDFKKSIPKELLKGVEV